jgi:hypothetical protein
MVSRMMLNDPERERLAWERARVESWNELVWEAMEGGHKPDKIALLKELDKIVPMPPEFVDPTTGRSRFTPRCNHPVRGTGQPCGRPVDHKGYHATYEVVQKHNRS